MVDLTVLPSRNSSDSLLRYRVTVVPTSSRSVSSIVFDAAVGFPADRLGIGQTAQRIDADLIRHHEGRIESQTKSDR